MGYSTSFDGKLKFKKELTGSQLSKLNVFLGEDRRDLGFNDNSVYENGKYGSHWYHIDLELTRNFSGLRWNGAKNTTDLDHIINWLIDKSGVQFELDGELLAQGDDIDDRWRLVMVDNRATRVELPRVGQIVVCPHCCEAFDLE